MLVSARRIVTENGPDGRSRIASDAPTPHTVETAPARGLSNLWACRTGSPDMTTRDGADGPVVLAPDEGGTIFRFFQLPPADASAGEVDGHEAAARVFAAMGGASAHVPNARHPNMHRTRSLDFIVLLQGRVKLILDDDETVLEPFDVVIQRETNHAWQNLSDEPAILMAVLIDSAGAAAKAAE